MYVRTYVYVHISFTVFSFSFKNELYASSTLQKPGLFSAANLVVRNTNTLQRFKRVSVDLNQGAEV